LIAKKFDMVFAVTDVLPVILSRSKKRLSAHTRLLVPDPEAFERANQKSQTLTFAVKAGVRVPKTHVVRNIDDLQAIRDILQYPGVDHSSARARARPSSSHPTGPGTLWLEFRRGNGEWLLQAPLEIR
jgi:hypothetical protein